MLTKVNLASVQFEKASTGILEDVSVQTLGIPPLFGLPSSDSE
jgi:hypothetical protein